MKDEGHRASWADSYREKEGGVEGQGGRGERINAQLEEQLRVYIWSPYRGEGEGRDN